MKNKNLHLYLARVDILSILICKIYIKIILAICTGLGNTKGS